MNNKLLFSELEHGLKLVIPMVFRVEENALNEQGVMHVITLYIF